MVDDNLVDPRREEMCTYSLRQTFCFGLMLFLTQAGSRRQLRAMSQEPAFVHNLAELCGDDTTVRASHTDTLDYFLAHLDPTGLGKLASAMTYRLIRSKVLDRYRLDGMVLVAIDGVTVLSLLRELAIPCRTQKQSNGDVRSLCAVVEAKVVTDSGMAFHLAAAFEDQPDTDGTKQDCERKAFARLAAELHRRHPQLQICILLDGLYADQGILDICQQYGWHYFITFKEGSLPAFAAETLRERERHPENCVHHRREDGVCQTIRWLENQQYAGHRLHLIYCDEVWEDRSEHHFDYLTNLRPTRNNVAKYLNQGARQRWKIENSFDDQKNGGYELEHDFGTRANAWKNYYYLLQIAHLLIQLILRGDLCSKLQRLREPTGLTSTVLQLFGSAKAFLSKLRAEFQLCAASAFLSDGAFVRGIQIRLDTG